jgi:adenylylsulfate kinase
VVHKDRPAFALWITGLPASGKSVISAALAKTLQDRGLEVAVLESDELRKHFSTHPSYDIQDREYFYGSMAFIGKVLTEHGVSVIFDATANRRAYRERARGQIPRFLEIYIDTPLETCIQRDPKGIYRKAMTGEAQHVPGLQADYEAPLNPDLVIYGGAEDPGIAASRIVTTLEAKGMIETAS